MAITVEAQFSYTVTLRRAADGVWRGRADPVDRSPHLVGNTPTITIVGGTLTMDTAPARRGEGFPHHVDTKPLASKAVIAMGDALEPVLHDEDVLHMYRGAMADVGLVLTRGGELILALGDVTGWLRKWGIMVETDPQVDDRPFYYMRSLLDRLDSRLVWLDPTSPEYESQLAELERIPPHVTMVSIAARADDWATSAVVNRRVVGSGRRRDWMFTYERVDTRFQTREDFVAYLRALPKQQPSDLFLRFTADGRACEIREGECVVREPWVFCVCEIAPPDSAWLSTYVGVARTNLALTPDVLRASARLIQQRHIQIELA